MSGGERRRLIVANLDCEADFAAEVGGAEARPRPALSAAARAAAAGAATLLRAFAQGGDRLWLPAAVDPARLADVPGLPRPELVAGPLAKLPAADAVLAWGATRRVAALRRGRSAAESCADDDVDPATPPADLAWRLPPADPAAAAAVNHRGFALELATALGCRLPGARFVASVAELERHLAAGGAEAGNGRWVAKAPCSAAGRERAFGDGGVLGDSERRRLAGLFARHGPLLFEPWMERLADYGVAAVAGRGGGVRIIGWHRAWNDRRGVFRGLELGVDPAGVAGLSDEERQRTAEAVAAVARGLAARGYHGPFGVDAWRYCDAAGRPAWNPLGEVNARLTFGWVARALLDRVRAPLGLTAGAVVRLHLAPARESLATRGRVALLHPAADSGLAAWLERVPALLPTPSAV